MACKVWYGMVWYGVVWYGMEWYGMVCMYIYIYYMICILYKYITNPTKKNKLPSDGLSGLDQKHAPLIQGLAEVWVDLFLSKTSELMGFNGIFAEIFRSLVMGLMGTMEVSALSCEYPQLIQSSWMT